MRLPATAALICTLTLPAAAQEIADTIYFGGPILTMDDTRPTVEAVAVKDGLILDVGPLDQVTAHQGDGTDVVDLGGRTMLPGFVDAHGHVFAIGLQALAANMLPAPDGEVNDFATLQRVLTDWAEAFPERVEPTNLILGFGYDDSQMAELEHPTRQVLDEVSADIPVYLIHQSGHIGVANTAALEVIGLTAESEEMPGGVIRREADGTPNGILEETPHFVALTRLLSAVDVSGSEQMFLAGVELIASYGYTTAQDGRSAVEQAQIMQSVASTQGIDIDVVSYPDVLVNRDFILETASSDYTDGFRVAGAKLTIDGSPQGFTALRDRPYYRPPPNLRADYAGYAAANADAVFEAVDWAFANGVQIQTHANGEGASDMLIAALRAAAETHGQEDRRPVLIHGQFLREDQVDAYVELEVFPSLFPMHTFYWGDWHRDRTVGPVNAENISPTGWFLQRGAMFSSHHDAPVAFPDSMRILDATVTRRSRSGDIIGPHHRVDVMTALKAMTLWPAYQHFEDDRKGSIETGKLADFVILSDDPTAVDPETLDSLTVMRTIKEDRVIYDVEEVRDGDLRYLPPRGQQTTFSRFLMAGAPWIGRPPARDSFEAAIRRAYGTRMDPHAAIHAAERLVSQAPGN